MDIREIVLQHFLGKVMLVKNCFFCLYLTFSFASNSGMSMIAAKDQMLMQPWIADVLNIVLRIVSIIVRRSRALFDVV